jgi:hypothetical protein
MAICAASRDPQVSYETSIVYCRELSFFLKLPVVRQAHAVGERISEPARGDNPFHLSSLCDEHMREFGTTFFNEG